MGGGAFSFGDNPIFESLIRFINSDKKFKDRFNKYIITTNCGFRHTHDSQDLGYCLEFLRDEEDFDSIRFDKLFSGRIDKLSQVTETDKSFVLEVLKKVWLNESMDLDRFEYYLAFDIGFLTKNTEQSLNVLCECSSALIGFMLYASSLPHAAPRSSYFEMLENPTSQKIDAIIKAKRITKDVVNKIIYEHLTGPLLLRSVEPTNISALPRSVNILELKAIAGGLSSNNIDLLKNNKISAEYLLTSWYHKYGDEKANRQYDFLENIVRTECQEAYDSIINNNCFLELKC